MAESSTTPRIEKSPGVRPSSAMAIGAVAAIAVLAVITVWDLLALFTTLHILDAIECVTLLGSVISLWGLVRAMGTDGAAAKGWMLLFGGVSTYFAGEIVFTTHRFVTISQVIFPSVADLFYVSGQLLIVAALLWLILAYSNSGLPMGSPSSYLILLVVVASLAAFLVGRFTLPMWADPSFSYGWKLVTTIYSSLDLATLCAALVLLRVAILFRGGVVAQGWAAIAVAFVFMTAGDTLFGIGVDERYAGLAFLASYASLTFGALRHAEVVRSMK